MSTLKLIHTNPHISPTPCPQCRHWQLLAESRLRALDATRAAYDDLLEQLYCTIEQRNALEDQLTQFDAQRALQRAKRHFWRVRP